MIRYLDTEGVIHEKKYNENTTDLEEIKKLYLYNKKIKEIKKLDRLTNLQELYLSYNQIKKIKELDKLTSLKILTLGQNQIKEIKGLDGFISLIYLKLSDNKIKEIKGLNGLTRLLHLNLSGNQINEIKGLDKLTRLQTLNLCHNQINEIKGLEGLTNLQELYLYDNEINEIKGLDRLIRLQTLNLSYNQITHVPFTIMSLRHLVHLIVDCEINVVIQRFLDRNYIKDNKTIYNDAQNVHDSNIVKSIKESIYNIMCDSKSITSIFNRVNSPSRGGGITSQERSNSPSKGGGISFEDISNEIINDKILSCKTKSQLIEYCQDKTVHSLLNLTFEEVLCSVWKVITEHKESNEIKEILNVEMKDSMCKCFTGRLSRLVNCLNGFDERVQIKISDKEQILNIIISIRNKYDNDINRQKEEVEKELTERGFGKDVINEYIVYLE